MTEYRTEYTQQQQHGGGIVKIVWEFVVTSKITAVDRVSSCTLAHTRTSHDTIDG